MTGRPPEKASVLCVDDDRLVRDILKQMLEQLGLTVRCVKTGRECLREFEAFGAYDLVLVNYDMPEMHGSEVIRLLLRTTTPEHIAVTSAYPEGAVFRDIPRDDVVGFLRKPYTLPILRRFLRVHLLRRPRWVLLTSPDASRRALYARMLEALGDEEVSAVDTFENTLDALPEASRSLSSVVLVDVPDEHVPAEIPLLHAEAIPLILMCEDEAPKFEMRRYGIVLDQPVEERELLESIRTISRGG